MSSLEEGSESAISNVEGIKDAAGRINQPLELNPSDGEHLLPVTTNNDTDGKDGEDEIENQGQHLDVKRESEGLSDAGQRTATTTDAGSEGQCSHSIREQNDMQLEGPNCEGESSSAYGHAGEEEEDLGMSQAQLQEYYGYEEAEPTTRFGQFRRDSLVGRIMTWAGAVNQEMFEAEHLHSPYEGGDYQHTRRHRRASADHDGRPRQVDPTNARTNRPRSHSSDEVQFDHSDRSGEDEHTMIAHMMRHNEDALGGDMIDVVGNKAARRNSLQAMVEKAMSMINMGPDREPDDLCPFGTRRDSLF